MRLALLDTGAATPPVLWVAAFVSFLCFILSLALTSVAMGAFILIWVLIGLRLPACTVQALLRSPLPWLLPLFAAVSVLWSDYPLTSGRNAAELMVTTGIALIIAQTIDARGFISAYMCAALLACLASVAVGGTGAASSGSDVGLVGVFGSKNEFSTYTSFALFCSAAVLLDRRQRTWLRWVAAFGVMLCPPLLWAGHSVGALVSDVLVLSFFSGVLLIGAFDTRLRPVLVAGLFALAATCSALMAFVVTDRQFANLLAAVGKDTTFTGRTYLWFRAEQLIRVRPFAGVGYQAFWVQGNPEAEGLWRYAKITSRHGFHFHNLFYETTIELGYFGLILLAAMVVATTTFSIRRLMTSWDVVSALFVSILLFFALRLYIEVDLLGPFAQGTFLLAVVWGYSTKPHRLGTAIVRNRNRPVFAVNAIS